MEMTSTQHTDTISLADAERQAEAVRKIMAEQRLEFGPAYDEYIARQQAQRTKTDNAMWRVPHGS